MATTEQVKSFVQKYAEDTGTSIAEAQEAIARVCGKSKHTVSKWYLGVTPIPYVSWAYLNLKLYGKDV